jgi:hypothetical protein
MFNQTEADEKDSSIPENNLEILKQKVENFYKLKVPIHVKFLDGHFKNGVITKVLNDFFIIDEFKDGSTFIFFSEISKIDAYKERGEK